MTTGATVLGPRPGLGLLALRQRDFDGAGLGRVVEDAHRTEEGGGQLLGPVHLVKELRQRSDGVVHGDVTRPWQLDLLEDGHGSLGRQGAGRQEVRWSSRAPRRRARSSARDLPGRCTPASGGGPSGARGPRRGGPSPARCARGRTASRASNVLARKAPMRPTPATPIRIRTPRVEHHSRRARFRCFRQLSLQSPPHVKQLSLHSYIDTSGRPPVLTTDVPQFPSWAHSR